MKIRFASLAFVLSLILLVACGAKTEVKNENKKVALMWFDAEANFERFSHKDSIDYYLKKVADLGFTHAVVDIIPIVGETLYDSDFAPRLRVGNNGYERKDFDFLGYFIEKGHEYGMEVHASMNVFCAGHNFFDKGLIYDSHPEWASMVYTPDKGIVPITEQKHKYSAMVNPIHPTFRTHILNIIKEVVTKYPTIDGLILDRVRYDGIEADFSELSRTEFEKYIGEKIERFPEDIFEWVKDADNKAKRVNGKHFNKWIEWRTKNIYDFMVEAKAEMKSANKNASFGTYTGAWYPSYYEVGVNFASKDYDPSKDYDWATPEYKNYGYAEVLDLYTTGNYYTDVTMEDYKKHGKTVWNETDSEAQSGTWYCVEGSNEKLTNVLKLKDFSGGILGDQFYEKPDDLRRSIEMNLQTSGGVMIFDIVHIINKDMWKEVEAGMRNGGMIEK